MGSSCVLLKEEEARQLRINIYLNSGNSGNFKLNFLVKMGADQSREFSTKKTETANFDFRFDFQNKIDDSSSKEKNKENSWKQKTEELIELKSEVDFNNQCYWLEVGMDVVKRIDNKKDF